MRKENFDKILTSLKDSQKGFLKTVARHMTSSVDAHSLDAVYLCTTQLLAIKSQQPLLIVT